MFNIKEFLADRVSAKLNRASIKSPSRWAEQYRMMAGTMPGKWSFTYHPWLKDMHDSKAKKNVGQKAAQVGFTEMLLNITFYKIDVEQIDCLYLLPSKTPDASDFSASRFDPALELSPHLANLFSEVKNVGHKRAGAVNLYIRGTQSKSALKSVPAGFIAFDEVEEMVQDNIAMAFERAAGQLEERKQFWMISTPTIEGVGINKEFSYTTQEAYVFKCPRCSRFTELIYPDCLVIVGDDPTSPEVKNSYLICKECKGTLHQHEKPEFLKDAIWVPKYPNRIDRGFNISQLYSYTVHPSELAIQTLKAPNDPAIEQDLYNSKLGLTHVVAGAKIDDNQINECLGSHSKNAPPEQGGVITMGIDVGSYLHYEIVKWSLPKRSQGTADINLECRAKVITFGKVKHFEQIIEIIRSYAPMAIVIDANPERRKAQELAAHFYGRVRLCLYGRGEQTKKISMNSDPVEPTVTVNRTSWLDQSLGRFRTGTISLPNDVDNEYRNHIKNLVRVPKKDAYGNPTAEYVTANGEDHYAHAHTYAEIALPLALKGMGNQTITEGVL